MSYGELYQLEVNRGFDTLTYSISFTIIAYNIMYMYGNMK
jgi:hypothetical protein